MTLHFAAWRNCECTDVQPTKDFPERCPCHGGYLLGTSTITDDAKTGHSCTLAGTRDR